MCLCIAVLSLACSWYLKGQSADENIEVLLHVRTELLCYKVDAVRLGESVLFAFVGFEKPCFFCVLGNAVYLLWFLMPFLLSGQPTEGLEALLNRSKLKALQHRSAVPLHASCV